MPVVTTFEVSRSRQFLVTRTPFYQWQRMPVELHEPLGRRFESCQSLLHGGCSSVVEQEEKMFHKPLSLSPFQTINTQGRWKITSPVVFSVPVFGGRMKWPSPIKLSLKVMGCLRMPLKVTGRFASPSASSKLPVKAPVAGVSVVVHLVAFVVPVTLTALVALSPRRVGRFASEALPVSLCETPKLMVLPVSPRRCANETAGVVFAAATGGSHGSIMSTVLTGPKPARYETSAARPAFFHVMVCCSR